MTTATVIAVVLQLLVILIIYMIWGRQDKHKLEILQCEIKRLESRFDYSFPNGKTHIENIRKRLMMHIMSHADYDRRIKALESSTPLERALLNNQKAMDGSNLDILNDISARVGALADSVLRHNAAMIIMNDRMSGQQKSIDCLGEEVKTTTDSLDRTIDHVSVRVDKLTEGEDAKKQEHMEGHRHVRIRMDTLDNRFGAIEERFESSLKNLKEGEDAKKHDFNSIIERLGKLEAR